MKSRAIPQLRLFLRFTGLFLVWSIVVGIITNSARFYLVLNFAKIGALFGAFLGLIAVVVALLYGEVRNHKGFKQTLVVCTSALPACLVAFLLHILSSVEVNTSGSIYSLAILSVFPCVVWISRIVARQVSARDFTEEAETETGIRRGYAR